MASYDLIRGPVSVVKWYLLGEGSQEGTQTALLPSSISLPCSQLMSLRKSGCGVPSWTQNSGPTGLCLGCTYFESRALHCKKAAPSRLLVPLKLFFTVVSPGSTHLMFPKTLPLHPPWLFFDNSLQVRGQETQALAVAFSLFLLTVSKSFLILAFIMPALCFNTKNFIHFSFTEDLIGQLKLTLNIGVQKRRHFCMLCYERCPTKIFLNSWNTAKRNNWNQTLVSEFK